jgi:hypothetical protein
MSFQPLVIASDVPFIMAGDYNVMRTDLDVYAPEPWRDDALFQPKVRRAYAEFVKLGWNNALRELNPGKRIYTFWKYFRNAFARDAGLRIDHLLLSPALKPRLVSGGVVRNVGRGEGETAGVTGNVVAMHCSLRAPRRIWSTAHDRASPTRVWCKSQGAKNDPANWHSFGRGRHRDALPRTRRESIDSGRL